MDSIGDFAERLINEQVGNIKQGKQLPPSQGGNLTPNGKDITNVTVPDSFMKQILGENFHPQETPADETIPELVWTQPEAPQPPQTLTEEPLGPQALTEETAQQLVPLLEEVKTLLKEMTAAATMSGGIGVNLGGPCEDDKSYEAIEKSYGYKKSIPSKLPGDSRKSILKNSIKNRLKKRK
tara:strand:+ start:1315 stop:1857 length:543 start_codon:yes stop_codon:yes gene_type:complete